MSVPFLPYFHFIGSVQVHIESRSRSAQAHGCLTLERICINIIDISAACCQFFEDLPLTGGSRGFGWHLQLDHDCLSRCLSLFFALCAALLSSIACQMIDMGLRPNYLKWLYYDPESMKISPDSMTTGLSWVTKAFAHCCSAAAAAAQHSNNIVRIGHYRSWKASAFLTPDPILLVISTLLGFQFFAANFFFSK